MLPSAMADLVNVLEGVARDSGSIDAGLQFVGALRRPCRRLAALPGLHGRARRELRPDIRSIACGDIPSNGYVIFFRYAEDAFEVVNIIEGGRDTGAAPGEAERIR
jgi:plasmid stabilization system protein ParE